jgi:Fic family protein
MAEVVKLTWRPAATSGLSRRDRAGCEYEAYVPDLLSGRPLALSGWTLADVAEAEREVARLNRSSKVLAGSEAMARLLLRAESVASSKIEGLEVGGRRLLKAQFAQGAGLGAEDVTATEILNNIEAMRWAVDELAGAERITVDGLLGIHRRLLDGTRLATYAGRLRTQQNWIGGSSFNPCAAAFVPPPPRRVRRLVEDLCAFCERDDLPAIVQAALAHAQFETIHPFVDGNGRAGRALIHVILRRRGLAPVALPPISLVLATWSRDYVNGLSATRHRSAVGSTAAQEGIDQWVSLFAAATTRAVVDAERYEARVADVDAGWRERLGAVRAGSAVELLLAALPGAPVLTVQTASALIGRSVQATNLAVGRLVETGVLKQTTVGRRNRVLEAPELIDAFNDLERRLASPEGSTFGSAPSRPVPSRTAS